MSTGGDALNDSHAEIIAKRSFHRYLLHQFSLAVSHTQNSIFIQGTEKGKWRLKSEISFIFFSSHTPCGDASIIPMIEQEDQPCQAVTSEKLLKQGKSTHNNIDRVTTVCNKRELRDMTHGGLSKRVRRDGDDASDKIEWDTEVIMKEAAIFLPLSSDRSYHELPATGEGANVRTWGAHLGQESTMVVADEGADTLHSIPDVAVEYVPPTLREEATPAPTITSEGNLHLVTIRERVNCSSGEQLTLARSAPQGSLNAAECFTTGSTCGAKVVDVYRTGAKCVLGELQDSLDPGLDYHLVGLLRVKPGRGDRTCSMSCSDKMSRWNVLGCQGALLMHFLQQPLYFSAFVIGKCPYSQDAMERALITRCQHIQSLPDGFKVQSTVLILQSGLQFPHSRLAVIPVHDASKGKLVPSGAAISWCKVPEQSLDVTANGYRQGATKKAIGTPQARSQICTVELFHTFRNLVAATAENNLPESLCTANLETFWDYKQAATTYQKAWKELRCQAFPTWIKTPKEYRLFK
ncbi:hypothetical protein NDU88_003687 [Pleurodeles waltl]|uniref:tRNA-specific adenosine deaminase 1 n=2 Tax=Pleurodeles waltl TaxID=8319 RepID=A0AAV7KX64_PLEWA|nr:hypothetical protein NDU88_003687 [Pleurodeles waltl]